MPCRCSSGLASSSATTRRSHRFARCCRRDRVSRRRRLSRPAAIRGYIDLVRQAIRRRLPTAPFVLPLSGGRDSRHLLYELIDAGCPPARCVTVRHFPPRGNEDEEIARLLCERVRAPPRRARSAARPDRRRTPEERADAFLHRRAWAVRGARGLSVGRDSRDVRRYRRRRAVAERLRRSRAAGPVPPRDVRGVADFLLHGHGNVVTERALSRLVAPQPPRVICHESARSRASSGRSPPTSMRSTRSRRSTSGTARGGRSRWRLTGCNGRSRPSRRTSIAMSSISCARCRRS